MVSTKNRFTLPEIKRGNGTSHVNRAFWLGKSFIHGNRGISSKPYWITKIHPIKIPLDHYKIPWNHSKIPPRRYPESVAPSSHWRESWHQTWSVQPESCIRVRLFELQHKQLDFHGLPSDEWLAMENHHFQWGISLFLWWFSIDMLVITISETGQEMNTTSTGRLDRLLQPLDVRSPWSSRREAASGTSYIPFEYSLHICMYI